MTIAEIIGQVFLPLSLAVIMLGMGMSLVPADFTRIARYPKSVFIGITNQLILLPIVGFSLAVLFGLSPTMAVGVMILAVAPGGATSNLITQVCRGNIALSVTLTAIVSFICILTIPLILSYSLEFFGAGTAIEIELPILDTIIQIMGITVIPISIGMVIRHYKTDFALRMEKPFRIASTVLFILVFIAICAANFDLLDDAMREVGLVTLLLNLITMGLGYGTSRLARLDSRDAVTITIESGIQNGTLSFVIATSILQNVTMGLPTGAYSIWMFITGGILMWQLGRKAAASTSGVSN